MPINVIVHDDVAAGTRIHSDASNTDYIIDHGVLFGSSDLIGLQLVSTHHDVWVHGTLIGGYAGVRLGNSNNSDYANALRVSATGAVQGDTGVELIGSGSVINAGEIQGSHEGISIDMSGYARSSVTNDGTIQGGERAIHVGAWDQGAFTLVNRGIIGSNDIAVAFSGLPGAEATITNHGTMQGHWAYLGGLGVDRFVNRGDLVGSVSLYEGNDRFDNRGGRTEGHVEGDKGDDLFLPGEGVEAFDGGHGTDTLDFQGSAGLRVSLMDDSGSGRAEGDTYLGFERIVGSRSGADALIGDDAANELLGKGGGDWLSGRGGADSLSGGADIDRLTGGAGDDAFLFLAPHLGADLVLDFRNAPGNDDRIELSLDGFGAGLSRGPLEAGRFVARATDSLAQEADDRLVFRADTATLWWDADGKGGAAAVLLADLQAGAVLTAADILLV